MIRVDRVTRDHKMIFVLLVSRSSRTTSIRDEDETKQMHRTATLSVSKSNRRVGQHRIAAAVSITDKITGS